ncbi:MAG TPA: hypothetical protein PK990_06345 [Salinivirgaceae bacterium]|nr:hypothetical protein [Salinivirgaceae bacterium]
MKKIFISLSVFVYFLSAQCQERDFNKISYGFQLVKFQNEFGIGVHLLTPEFKNLRINVKTNLNWLNHPDAQNNQTWTEFINNQVGINYQRCITNNINLYSEGGIVLIYPNNSFSNESVNFGGYGVFGFEFFLTENTSRNPSYFIELGGIGTGAVANKVVSKPIYSNGFLISVGYRF